MKSIVLLIAVWLMVTGCTKDKQYTVIARPASCDSTGFSYALVVRPIVALKCSGTICHSGGNSNYNYSTYEVLADRVRTGRLEDRLLLPKSDPMHMPEGGNLDSCDLFILRIWIHQGFKNN